MLLVFVVYVVLNPWAPHTGGRWTPAMTWHGVGKLLSTSARTMPVHTDNLTGTAKLCNREGEIYPLTVSGYIKRVWLDVDRKPVMFYFRSPEDAQRKLYFELLGSWQGQQPAREDRGSMAVSFAPDGGAKGCLKGADSPKENTPGTLHHATDSEFSSACSAKNGNSFSFS